ncbi:sentrin-specific protease 7b [Scomber scombrus]|uniref:Sentrin-specific protease 7b n=1 Tax=Scomber scombrus TaxID=13677 RepID=A0AAV1Q8A3_SCOSC
MASQFKIPKKKQATGSDSASLQMQSPLSRLQNPAQEFKSYGDRSGRGDADRMHAGSSLGSTDGQSAPCKPFFRDVVKTLLGLNSPSRGASSANHRAAGSLNRQSQKAEASSVGLSNGWRPKRASDRLLQPDASSERRSPPQKKKSESCGSPEVKKISVASFDSLAALRGDEHDGSLSTSPWRRDEGTSDSRKSSSSPLKQQKKNSSLSDSEDDFLSPSRPRNKPSASSSSSSSVSMVTPDRRRSLDRTLMQGDWREKERERWREFKARKTSKSAVLHLRLRAAKPTPSEPIVLSSEEEEEEEEEEGADAGKTTQSGGRLESLFSEQTQDQQVGRHGDGADELAAPPSFLQLEFVSLHAGLTHADANGHVMITENGITLPLKGVEEGDVTVVASQVRGYGVWDGGVARGGTLLAGWEGPAPSLLFLWVTDAQANLLQRELAAIQTAATAGPSCSFLLLVLKEQLQELQAALLASILDMEEFRKGRSSSSSSSSSSSTSAGPSSPLDWTDGLLLLHSCPPPLDQHLLRLLGHSQVRSRKSCLRSAGVQQLPSRLIQYPAAPCKGRITVSREDLFCLNDGEFLNDVIIDFYLKFLLLEGVSDSVSSRSHVFSSFFYKQLSRRRAAGEDDVASVPDRHTRHQRVKTWTRHVDIFTKDFLFIPVNQEAHWFLVVVCFAGLQEIQYETRQSRKGSNDDSSQQPQCSELGCLRETVLQRSCILVMDSLKLSYHDNVCRLLRDYLQVEWEVRRGTPRLFTADTMRSSSCRVPQQDNSSDCGLYLLQYVESFLKNPVVHFELPLRLDGWFPRQQVRRKREEIRRLIMKMYDGQQRRTKHNLI